jgi:signal transduction histidine kinase
VDNALLYSDGPVTLAASTGPAGLASPHHGSGIGLSVVRLLIEAMGGRGQVAAKPGGGADFQLALPGVGRSRGSVVRGGDHRS